MATLKGELKYIRDLKDCLLSTCEHFHRSYWLIDLHIYLKVIKHVLFAPYCCIVIIYCDSIILEISLLVLVKNLNPYTLSSSNSTSGLLD